MTKRPNLLVALGAALFLVGGAIVFLVLRSNDDGASASTKQLVPVLVATDDLALGESGDAILSAGRVVVRQVPLGQRRPDALTATTALAGQSIGAPITDGGQVVSGSLRAPNLRTAAIRIPKGKQAIAITVNFTAGAAGYAAAGDRVNVYTLVAPNAPNASPTTVATGADPNKVTLGTPYAKLLLSNVEVLDVSDEVAPRLATTAAASSSNSADNTSATGERAATATLTVLLALDAQQAEQAVFATSVNSLYLTVLPKGQGPSTTKGVGYGHNYPVPAQEDVKK